MNIGGLQKCSLIDYPNKLSAVIFTRGCNFNCPYCHNPELVKTAGGSSIDESSVLTFLQSRKNKLDAVVITGGEPCLQPDIVGFASKIKEEGFLLKLDTNGSYPLKLRELLTLGLVDYVAMDVKAPVFKYHEISKSVVDVEKILESIDIIKSSGVDYEFRTTVVRSQLCFEDFEKIGKMIKGTPRYYLQKFVFQDKILDRSLQTEETYSDEEFQQISGIMKKYAGEVFLR